jgi:AcrR family transcriptional regulator
MRRIVTSPPRKPRADAQRNRERLLLAARAAFTRSGVEVSLDEIAKEAGVGPGTLYRHFATREALIEAVYRSEVAKLAEAEPRLSATHSPVEALRAWLNLFVDYMAAKKILAPALNTILGGASCLRASTSETLSGAVGRLVERAASHGDMRPDLDPVDLLRALAGISTYAATEWSASARRMIDVLLQGARPEPALATKARRTRATAPRA